MFLMQKSADQGIKKEYFNDTIEYWGDVSRGVDIDDSRSLNKDLWSAR